jgi:hypothetical protein
VIIRSEGFEGARAALEEMPGSSHQVFLCTSPVIGSRWCAQEKLAWIEHHLGRAWLRPTIITSDKTVGDSSSRASWWTTGPGSREQRSRPGSMCSLTPRIARDSRGLAYLPGPTGAGSSSPSLPPSGVGQRWQARSTMPRRCPSGLPERPCRDQLLLQ